MELIFEEEFFSSLKSQKKYTSTMLDLKLNWDGSDIGAIDENISHYRKWEDDHIITLWYTNAKGEKRLANAKILRYKNEVPIIIDECKPLFGLKKIGKHKATLMAHKVILVKFQGDISLKKYLNDMLWTPKKTSVYFKEEIRKVFAFRHIMCLNNNFSNTIEVRTGGGINYPISCRENTFNYESGDPATRIPKTVVKEWFNDSEDLVEEVLEKMVTGKDVSMLRIEIQKIIMKFDKHLISWNNGIFEKLLFLQKN